MSVLRLLDFPWSLSLLFEFRFFSSASASCSQLYLLLSYSGMLASSCFPRIFWVLLILWGLPFLRFQLWLYLFFALWSSLFRMLQFGLLLVVFLSIFFSTRCGYGCLVPFFLRVFPPAAVLAVPSFFSPPFQSVVTLPVLYGLCPSFSVSYASGCSSLLPRLLLSSILRVLLWQSLGCPGAAFPAFLLVFFRMVFTACLVFLVPRAVFSPLVYVPPRTCCGVLRSGFSSFSAGSALL